jgi:hypothetical protein
VRAVRTETYRAARESLYSLTRIRCAAASGEAPKSGQKSGQKKRISFGTPVVHKFDTQSPARRYFLMAFLFETMREIDLHLLALQEAP